MSKCGPKTNWECTEFCKSMKHSNSLISAVTKRSVTDKQVASYLYDTCCNFAKIHDNFGRTPLHIAASCGRLDLCVWLAAVAGADVNARDWESGYTALQRSVIYGNIDVAVRLIEIGADVTVSDKEDISPLELVTLERLPEVKISSYVPTQLYVWGSNLNFTLGTGTDDPKKHPELLDYFKRNGVSLKQVCTDEFHSVFVSSSGQVWVCGHGRGGRLGMFKEKPLLIPTHLTASSEECVMAATALNQTLLLLGNGSVLAFGSNRYHQLGITPYVESCLSPKHVNLSNIRSSGPITGICAAKYHSVFYNENIILVCGMNAGQLGCKCDIPFISVPQQISGKEKSNMKIKNVATSVGSIVYSLNSGDVFIVHRFQIKKIASRLPGVVKLAAFGGHLSNDTITEIGEDLKILILTMKGTVIYWEESAANLMKCTYGLKKVVAVSDIFLNESNVLLTTVEGEAFQGTIKEKEPMSKTPEDRKRHSGGHYRDERIGKSQEKMGKCLISAKRIPYVHRAISITSDPKGKNFAVIQAHPNDSLEICLEKSPSEFVDNLKTLLLNASEDDTVHDVMFNVMGTRIPAHRYILAVNEFPFELLHNNKQRRTNTILEIQINDAHPLVFKELLMFLYTGHCTLMNTGPCSSRFTELKEDPLNMLTILARKYKINSLLSKLDMFRYENGYILSKSKEIIKETARMMQRKLFPEFYDVELKSDNGKTIKAHKCVLTARLPYFNSMFLRGWSETSKAQTVHLQTSALIAEAFIDFLYTDDIPDYINCDELDNSIRLLILSDQLIVNQLKEACEILLAKSINLKNCVSILQVCNVYNTLRLKEPVLRFIIQNLNAVLESRTLEALDDKTLLELSEYYKKNNRSCENRIITPYNNAPSDAEMLAAANNIAANSENFFGIPLSIKDACFSNKRPNLTTPNTKKKNSKRLSFHNSESNEDDTLQQVVPDNNKECFTQDIQNENVQFFDESEFPSLAGNKNHNTNKNTSFRLREKAESRRVLHPALSQKQKKKKSIETEELTVSPPKTQFKGWAIIPPVQQTAAIINVENSKKTEPNLFEIITNEQKEKDNWKKMKSKPFHLTQIEDAAMDDLILFYNANNIFDERITVERVLPVNIAQPIWIPGQKKKAYEEF